MSVSPVLHQVGTASFLCSGCDNAESKPIAIEVTHEHIGGGIDKVAVRRPSLADMTPDGWMVDDPYTHCTYCPDCWASIDGDTP